MRAVERYSPRTVVTVRIRCGGQLHRITVTPRGTLVLEDHSREEQMAERALIALGGEPSRCLQVLYAWRRGYSEKSELPRKLKVERERLREKGLRRRRESHAPDPLDIPLQIRVEERVVRWVQEALVRTRYRRTEQRGGYVRHGVLVKVGSPPQMQFARATVENGRQFLGYGDIWNVQVPLRWWRLRKLGADVVDGLFVLDLFEELPDGSLRVLVAEQRGLDFVIEEAVLGQVENEWRIILETPGRTGTKQMGNEITGETASAADPRGTQSR